jgi:tetratricopeptide (TPR) repeat protein
MKAISALASLLAAVVAAGTAGAEDTTYCDQGLAALHASSYEEAIGLYDRCLRDGELSRGMQSVAYNNRGSAYRLVGDPDRAIQDLDQAIRLDPAYPSPYSNRGNAYADKGDLDRAIADYDEAIRLKPDYAVAYFNRGNARSARGEVRLAMDDYGKAADLDSRDPDARNALAWLLATTRHAHLRDGARAVAVADAALALRPGDPAILDTLAAAYAETGRFAEAVALQEKAIAGAKASGLPPAIVADLEERLTAFEQAKPWHE